MTTRKLLWEMTWQGRLAVVDCTIALVVYGAIYGITWLGSNLLDPVQRVQILNYQGNFIISILGLIVFGLIFAWLGGVFIGLAFGIPGGFVIGIITRLFFFPLENIENYRRVIMAVCAICGLLCSLEINLWVWNFVSSPHFHALDPGYYQAAHFFPRLATILPEFVANIFFAVIVSISLGRKIAAWYERESTKGIAQNVSPN